MSAEGVESGGPWRERTKAMGAEGQAGGQLEGAAGWRPVPGNRGPGYPLTIPGGPRTLKKCTGGGAALVGLDTRAR